MSEIFSCWLSSRLKRKTSLSGSSACSARASRPLSFRSLTVLLSPAMSRLSTTKTAPARSMPSRIWRMLPGSASLFPGRSMKPQPPSRTAAGTKRATSFATTRSSRSSSFIVSSTSWICLRSWCRDRPSPQYSVWGELVSLSTASQTLTSLQLSGSSSAAGSSSDSSGRSVVWPCVTLRNVCHASLSSSFCFSFSMSSGSSSPSSRRIATNKNACCFSSATVYLVTSMWTPPP
mmetsp:Transcript_37215/g.123314  ORF Transcript_37215/g.123314 Transcript_37215/m.123314 type:complete len:233 (-) Transcript_37215:1201-1899(-)